VPYRLKKSTEHSTRATVRTGPATMTLVVDQGMRLSIPIQTGISRGMTS